MCRHKPGALICVFEFRVDSNPMKEEVFTPNVWIKNWKLRSCTWWGKAGGQASQNSSPNWFVSTARAPTGVRTTHSSVRCSKGVFCTVCIGVHVWVCMYECMRACVRTTGTWIYLPCLQRPHLHGGGASFFLFSICKNNICFNLIHSLVVKDVKFQHQAQCLCSAGVDSVRKQLLMDKARRRDGMRGTWSPARRQVPGQIVSESGGFGIRPTFPWTSLPFL